MAARPTCASCRHYHAPEAADDLPERARAAAIYKRPSDWCGQHQTPNGGHP